MIDFDVVASIAEDRPEFTALACVPVALPYWRLRVRIEVLARRPISPLEEYVMRASREADPQLPAIRSLLGLDDRTFQGTISALVERGWAFVQPGEDLRLTEKGSEAANTAMREQSESRVISIDYDGLLRRPIPLDLPVESQQRRSLGLREIPAWPAVAPDVLELQDSFGELQTIVRRSGDGRDQEVELLAVRGLLRKERIYREAMLVLLRSSDGRIQTAPLIDGVLSDEHERALSQPGPLRQLRLAGELRRGPRYNTLLPQALRAHYDESADVEARLLRVRARRSRSADGADDDARLAEQAQFATRALKVRGLLPHEHPRLVTTALKTVRDRLLLATPVISDAVLGRDMVADFEAAIGRGVRVTVAYNAESPSSPPEWLQRMSEKDKRLTLRAVSGLSSSTMILDESLAVRTLFPLLSYYGIERPYRDERGWLVNRPEHVLLISEQTSDLFTPAS